MLIVITLIIWITNTFGMPKFLYSRFNYKLCCSFVKIAENFQQTVRRTQGHGQISVNADSVFIAFIMSDI